MLMKEFDTHEVYEEADTVTAAAIGASMTTALSPASCGKCGRHDRG
ncbi:MAG: hypothetical protein ACLSFT_07495 [Ruminococcus callidus]